MISNNTAQILESLIEVIPDLRAMKFSLEKIRFCISAIGRLCERMLRIT